MSSSDTIFALSSGSPPAGIAVIRISGPQAFPAVEALAGRVPEPRRASLARLRDPDGGGLLDEALVLAFPGPGSATGEDLAELHLHGGRAVVRAVETALAGLDGLRAAEAGEFTRRAFQNGRMDLNEAEALGDLLSAESEWQRRAAMQTLGGQFGARIEGWRSDILRLAALVEAELDFSDEDDVAPQQRDAITNSCAQIAEAMTALLAQPPAEKLRDGLRVVLGGPPNSGKSTLLNAIVQREAAIVSDIAGTTRDVIEVPVALKGIPLVFADTAGVREGTTDAIEEIGIERAQAAFAGADMVLWLGGEGAGPAHPQLIEIEAQIDNPAHTAKSTGALKLSAKTGEGIDRLLSLLCDKAAALLPPPDSYAINARQRREINRAVSALQSVQAETDLLIIAEHLRQARLALDALTGRAATEDMLDTLFGRFCIGK